MLPDQPVLPGVGILLGDDLLDPPSSVLMKIWVVCSRLKGMTSAPRRCTSSDLNSVTCSPAATVPAIKSTLENRIVSLRIAASFREPCKTVQKAEATG